MTATESTPIAPLLVIGTHRSGTTLLGRALQRHRDVAYWEEPRHVWSWGHNYRGDDRLEAGDATPRIRKHIRGRFERFLEATGKSRLAEKTPSNCLRLDFIREIFPDAQYLHIYRDARAVVHSMEVVLATDHPRAAGWVPRLLGTPVWEWPAFAGRAWRTLGRRLLGRPMEFWGPRPPGWHQWVRSDPRPVVVAKQWLYCIEPVFEFRDRIDRAQWLDIKYEELVTDPLTFARRIEDFAGLAPDPAFQRHLVENCRLDRIDAWRSHLDHEKLESIRPILQPTLDRLGYAW